LPEAISFRRDRRVEWPHVGRPELDGFRAPYGGRGRNRRRNSRRFRGLNGGWNLRERSWGLTLAPEAIPTVGRSSYRVLQARHDFSPENGPQAVGYEGSAPSSAPHNHER
jgi:hypothetical protein